MSHSEDPGPEEPAQAPSWPALADRALQAVFEDAALHVADGMNADRTVIVYRKEEALLTVGARQGFLRFSLYHNAPISLTVLEDAAMRGRTTLSYDARTDHETQQTLSLQLSEAVSILCVPFFNGEGLPVGAIYSDTLTQVQAFRHRQLRFARECAVWLGARLNGATDVARPVQPSAKPVPSSAAGLGPSKVADAAPDEKGSRAETASGPTFGSRVKVHDVALFSHQLSMMLSQGISLFRAMDVAAQGAAPELEEVLRLVQGRLEGGEPLSKALAAHPEAFGQLYVLLTSVGEETGNLAPVLASLGDTLTKADEVRRRLTQAMIYPAFVLGSSALMVTLLVSYMLPGFVSMFAQSGKELPLLTRVVMGLFGHPLFRLGVPLLVLLPFWLKIACQGSPALATKVRVATFRLPLIGSFLTRMALLNSVRSLALLQSGGVDFRRALRCLDQARTGYQPLDSGFERVEIAITEGASLAEAFRQPVFPTLLIGLVEVGQETGELGPLLHRFVDILEEELENQIESLLALLEPLMMAFLGVVVGTVVLAAFLPTYNLVMQL